MGAEEFDYAADRVWDLPRDLNHEDLLRVYSLYKQGTIGDCNIPKPSGWDLKALKKWEAWNSLRGMPMEEARDRYVLVVKELFIRQNAPFYPWL